MIHKFSRGIRCDLQRDHAGLAEDVMIHWAWRVATGPPQGGVTNLENFKWNLNNRAATTKTKTMHLWSRILSVHQRWKVISHHVNRGTLRKHFCSFFFNFIQESEKSVMRLMSPAGPYDGKTPAFSDWTNALHRHRSKRRGDSPVKNQLYDEWRRSHDIMKFVTSWYRDYLSWYHDINDNYHQYFRLFM